MSAWIALGALVGTGLLLIPVCRNIRRQHHPKFRDSEVKQ